MLSVCALFHDGSFILILLDGPFKPIYNKAGLPDRWTCGTSCGTQAGMPPPACVLAFCTRIGTKSLYRIVFDKNKTLKNLQNSLHFQETQKMYRILEFKFSQEYSEKVSKTKTTCLFCFNKFSKKTSKDYLNNINERNNGKIIVVHEYLISAKVKFSKDILSKKEFKK
jgi:hypothetical protein